MKYKFVVLVLFMYAASFTQIITAQQSINISDQFDKYGVRGCFLLYNAVNDSLLIYNSSRIDSGYLPASTFKIPHSLIALELGVVTDGKFTLEWDGVERSVKAWNRSHNLTSAIKNSVVWYFEEIARRIGKNRLKDWLVKINYGNRDVTGGDPFWLRGNLRISPRQQLDFIKQFFYESLPFKKHSYEIIKKAVLIDSSDTYKLSGKTGWVSVGNIDIGWHIGYIETNNGLYFYVTNVESALDNPKFAESRYAITKSIFKELGIIPGT